MKLRTLFIAGLALFTAQTTLAKNLIIYFTNPESVPTEKLDGVSGASVILKNQQRQGGNEYLARLVQENVGGDLFRLETVQTYPDTHQAVLDFAQAEARKNIKPALKTLPNLDGYDTVFIAYPIWWYQMPMPLYSLFEQVDFAGKTIVPIVGHGGSRFSGSIEQIQAMQPKATVKDGFEAYIYRTTKADSRVESDLAEWIKKNGYQK